MKLRFATVLGRDLFLETDHVESIGQTSDDDVTAVCMCSGREHLLRGTPETIAAAMEGTGNTPVEVEPTPDAAPQTIVPRPQAVVRESENRTRGVTVRRP